MANNSTANVTTGKPKIGGYIYRAPLGTVLPTDATTDLAAAFINLGYVSEDGVSENLTPDIETVKDWGGDTIAVMDNGIENTYGFKLLEVLNEEVQKVVHGDDNVSGTIDEGLTVKVNSDTREHAVYVIEMIFNENILARFVIPEAAVTDIGEISYVKSELVGYDITITGLPDSSGNTAYKYYKKKS